MTELDLQQISRIKLAGALSQHGFDGALRGWSDEMLAGQSSELKKLPLKTRGAEIKKQLDALDAQHRQMILERTIVAAHRSGKRPLPDVTVRCCGCSGEVTFVVPKAANGDLPTLFHTMPYCERFNETNTAEGIVQYIRDCDPQLEEEHRRILGESSTYGSQLDEFKRVTGHTPLEFVAFLKKLALQVPLLPLTSALNVEVATMGIAHVVWSAIPSLETVNELVAFQEICEGTDDPTVIRVRKAIDAMIERVHPATEADANQYLFFAKEWRVNSYARLEVGHKLAASLCLTDIPEDLVVRYPWTAWSLVVPDGLLGDLARIWIHSGPLSQEGGDAFLIDRHGRQLVNPSPALSAMGASLIKGCALALSNPEDFRKDKQHRPTARSSKHRTGGAPDLGQARFMLSAPISVDLREHVQEALSGKKRGGGSPTVQFLVRGHWRQQAYGPDRSLRKPIWIQPFWKGPEESRVLLRTYKAEDKDVGT